ncbi:MAG: radical SAM protein [Acidimicrobiales bacterium]
MPAGAGRAGALEVAAAPLRCASPAVQLFLRPDGEVRVCCINEHPLGHVPQDRLRDLWDGHVRRAALDRLADGQVPDGCQGCAAEVAAEGWDGSYPATFEEWSGDAASPPAWPQLLSFNLSIECNLQCVQCDGEQSSAIRIHREHRPRLVSPYDDRFFEDVVPFLAHARRAIFSGGEPFLASENYRLWDAVAASAPHLDCRVITNATQWSARVEAVLERVDLGFVFSIDGMSAATFEAIRVGARFDAVMANLERFLAVARERGTWCSINHCLMAENAHEFADLLAFAEARALPVDVSVVRKPSRHSVVRLHQDEIRSVVATLEARDAEMEASLVLNLATWRRELDRLRRWAALSDDGRRRLRGASGELVAGVPRLGDGPLDDRAARDALAARAPGATVHHIDIGEGDVVVAASASVAEVGLDVAALVGRSGDEIPGALAAAIGPLGRRRELGEVGGGPMSELEVGTMLVRSVVVPMRDADGWAATARIAFTVEPLPAP